MFIFFYSFFIECLKFLKCEVYVIVILYYYRALNDLGFLNIGWFVGLLSVIIYFNSYLFICLEDLNILYFVNLFNIFLWENVIEKICFVLEN